VRVFVSRSGAIPAARIAMARGCGRRLCGFAPAARLCRDRRMNIAEARAFFDFMELSTEEAAIADRVMVEIRQRLKFLNDVAWSI